MIGAWERGESHARPKTGGGGGVNPFGFTDEHSGVLVMMSSTTSTSALWETYKSYFPSLNL